MEPAGRCMADFGGLAAGSRGVPALGGFGAGHGKVADGMLHALFSASGIWDMEAAEFRYLYDVYQGKFREIVPYPERRYHHERLRIGYLSADLCEHPVASLLYPLLQYHDRSRFRVYCYSATAHEDHVTALLREKAEIWRDIANASDAEAAETLRQDEIDILFDLSVHTKDSRLSLLAYRPATVQISGIGDVNSTGLPAVDYFLTDRCCMEERAMRDFFVERPLCLPHCHFCYAPLKEMPEPAAAPCRENGYITFGSFNNFGKMTDEMLALWCRILRAVPESRLILKHQLFDSEEGRSFVREKLERIGFPFSRVELRGFSKTYLQEYRELDIALDTHPYTGASRRWKRSIWACLSFRSMAGGMGRGSATASCKTSVWGSWRRIRRTPMWRLRPVSRRMRRCWRFCMGICGR